MESKGVPPATPRWVKVFSAIAVIILVMLVLVVHLHGMSGMRSHH
jgi:hypothetical protein